MADPPHSPSPANRKVIEDAIAEMDEVLRAAPPSAAVRELRVKHGHLARVVRGWSHHAPHAAQVGAMMECVLELRAAVAKVCPPRTVQASHAVTRPPPRGTRAQLKSTRPPPPRRAAANLTTRPPPKAAAGPPTSRRG